MALLYSFCFWKQDLILYVAQAGLELEVALASIRDMSHQAWFPRGLLQGLKEIITRMRSVHCKFVICGYSFALETMSERLDPC